MIERKIKELELLLGFEIKRNSITNLSNQPYNEIFSYDVFQNLHNKKQDLEKAIELTSQILLEVVTKRELYFSLLGNLYYLNGELEKSIGCFMKALTFSKNDLTIWIELAFALRSFGEFTLFEDIMFNIDSFFLEWRNSSSNSMNKERLFQLRNKIVK